MLENILLIASVISALTALTTSLRALGKSRENQRSNMKSNIATSSRLGTFKADGSYRQRHSLVIYIISTLVWFFLSIMFVIPLFMQKWSGKFDGGLVAFLLPFLVLVILICFIWKKTIFMKISD